MSGADDELWVGIDVGTQSVRVLVVSGDGTVHGRGNAPLTGSVNGRRHEQDPASWWDALQTAAQQAMTSVGARALRGVALDATSGTVVLVDDHGEPLTPALMYDDTRAIVEAANATEVGGDLWRRLGYQRIQPAWGLAKIIRLLGEYTALSGAHVAHQADFLNAKLCGHRVASDLSNTLKSGCDLITESWPVDIMADLDIPESVLPPLVRPGEPIGAVCSDAARATGFPAGLPVYAGMTDGCAAQLGAGVVGSGDWNCVLGTTLVLKGVADGIITDPSGAVYSHRSPDGRWLPGGASSSGAGMLVRALPDGDLDALAAAAEPRLPADVLIYPLASERGERFPFVEPAATPFHLGTPRDDVERYAAITQAIAFVERLCFDHLDRLGAPVGGRRVLSGGTATSSFFNHLRADVMGHPVTVVEQAESAMGMAVLAAASRYGLHEAAAAMVSERAVLDPRPERHAEYQEPYARFVTELHDRGWIDRELTDHAHRGVLL